MAKRIAFLLVIAALVACSSVEVSKERPVLEKASVISEYKIGVSDQLQISVWRNPDLSVGVPVRPDGKISVP